MNSISHSIQYGVRHVIWLLTKYFRQFCQDHGVVFVAFSPLGSPDLPWGEKLPHILADPIINKVYEIL